jgi:hypothetical protein
VNLQGYLQEFARDYDETIDRVELARCAACDGTAFEVGIDDEVGYAARACVACDDLVEMLDSADVAEEAEPGAAACPCGNETFEAAVGFSLTEAGEVRWVFVALRCQVDGTLGVYADWSVDYEPSTQLFEQV